MCKRTFLFPEEAEAEVKAIRENVMDKNTGTDVWLSVWNCSLWNGKPFTDKNRTAKKTLKSKAM